MDEIEHVEEKLAQCEAAIRENPTLASGYCERGLLLRDLKRYDEALAAFEHAIQLDPALAFAYSGKGVVLIDLQCYEEALQAFDQVIERDPTYVRAYKNKGGTLMCLKRYKEAIATFEKASQLDPSDSSIRDLITRLERYRGRILLRKTNRIYSELWRMYYAVFTVAFGFTMAFLALQVNVFLAIGMVILTIGATLILFLKTFRPVKRAKYNRI